MERNIQKIGLVDLVILLGVGVAGFALANFSHTLAGELVTAFIGLGFLVAAVSYFQMRLETAERLEKLEFDELTKSPKSATLFNAGEAEAFPAQRSREQFDRWIVPGFTIMLFVLQAGGAFLLWQWLPKSLPPSLHEPMVALALFGLFALALFLLGKYSVGLARLEDQRLLRPGASYLLLGAYLCFLVLAAVAAVSAGFPLVDLYVARALCVLLGLNAAETLINLVLEIYRPRVKGQVVRLLYESRLVGLLGQPEGLITTAAQALDYQFGFKVSDTWFYRFLEKSLVWLVVAQLGILMLSSCFVFVAPGDQALLERFGQSVPGRALLDPGPHLKLPWPIDQVHRFATQGIQSFEIGSEHGEMTENAAKTVLWTVTHTKDEFNLLVAARETGPGLTSTNANGKPTLPPVNLLSVGVPVQYQISDLRLWAYKHTDAANLLQKIASREVVRYLVSVDLNDIMSRGRGEAADQLRQRIQKSADELELGVQILFVGMEDIHPPVKVAPDYEKVVAALQEKQARVLEAEGDRARAIPLARALAARRVREAESYQLRTVAAAAAQAGQFGNQEIAFRAAPTVYAQRAYLQTLARGAANSRKIILGTTNTQDSVQLDLQDSIAADMLKVRVTDKR